MSRNILTRMVGATTLGAAVTASVLWLMQSLIESDRDSVEPAPPGATLTFLPVIDETPPDVRDPVPAEPDKPELPPPPPRTTRYGGEGQVIGTAIEPPELEGPTGPGALGLGDGDALPVVKVRPIYPESAASRGIEGHVLVQFTIDELGRVVDVTVVEAEPRGVFERAALRAVERFRYKPRVVNGTPTPVSGVQHLVTFALES